MQSELVALKNEISQIKSVKEKKEKKDCKPENDDLFNMIYH